MDTGTLVKLDTRDGAQSAEYDSVILDGSNHPEPPGAPCDRFARRGNCPSRTAVALDGSVSVANRAFEGQGTVTKIAGVEEDCVDRNGDGPEERYIEIEARLYSDDRERTPSLAQIRLQYYRPSEE
jgi:hypothetical protein